MTSPSLPIHRAPLALLATLATCHPTPPDPPGAGHVVGADFRPSSPPPTGDHAVSPDGRRSAPPPPSAPPGAGHVVGPDARRPGAHPSAGHAVSPDARPPDPPPDVPSPPGAGHVVRLDAGGVGGEAPGRASFVDGFQGMALGPGWVAVRSGDPPAPLAAPRGGRLALALDTLGTDPTTLKVVGVRTRSPMRLGRVEWTLDWNQQRNGSYLKAALYVSPHATTGDPAELPDWIRVEHVGVPPGERWRHTVAEQQAGSLRYLDQAGWPADRSGRPPGAPRCRLDLQADGRVTYAEDGVVRSAVRTARPFTVPVYVYLTLTSHSNYPRRTVYIDNVRLSAPPSHVREP